MAKFQLQSSLLRLTPPQLKISLERRGRKGKNIPIKNLFAWQGEGRITLLFREEIFYVLFLSLHMPETGNWQLQRQRINVFKNEYWEREEGGIQEQSKAGLDYSISTDCGVLLRRLSSLRRNRRVGDCDWGTSSFKRKMHLPPSMCFFKAHHI